MNKCGTPWRIRYTTHVAKLNTFLTDVSSIYFEVQYYCGYDIVSLIDVSNICCALQYISDWICETYIVVTIHPWLTCPICYCMLRTWIHLRTTCSTYCMLLLVQCMTHGNAKYRKTRYLIVLQSTKVVINWDCGTRSVALNRRDAGGWRGYNIVLRAFNRSRARP